ncbi:alpha/beta fold hydrolase [Propylenella binzhouense]|uniref:Alpha/beta fold hydrolase n=1 Tax=Propylenella binzhouense TaxID=2555902 RepID=A0A964T1V9_9HYPH|nr:alpha/beta fold hydrolase [Propylenella binzhouense]MYZ46719.1 alpha/beta fold hydrolase [Propylenella binzhouense]
MGQLYARVTGKGEGAPIVLLHGFGASHRAWRGVAPMLEESHRVIAFDLPGHALSLDYPHTGNAGVAAKAVMADLDERGFDRVHLVGHSMGGAVAALIAVGAPGRVASATLLAPGGFGPEINHRLLRRYAAATGEAELALVLEQFWGWEQAVPEEFVRGVAALRARKGQQEALTAIVETLLDGPRQRVLPISLLENCGVKVQVAWGTQDCVLPVRQAEALRSVSPRLLQGLGHMLPEEAPEAVAGLVLAAGR